MSLLIFFRLNYWSPFSVFLDSSVTPLEDRFSPPKSCLVSLEPVISPERTHDGADSRLRFLPGPSGPTPLSLSVVDHSHSPRELLKSDSYVTIHHSSPTYTFGRFSETLLPHLLF